MANAVAEATNFLSAKDDVVKTERERNIGHNFERIIINWLKTFNRNYQNQNAFANTHLMVCTSWSVLARIC